MRCQARRRCRIGVVGRVRERCGAPRELQNPDLVETAWNGLPEKVTALYAKGQGLPMLSPSTTVPVKFRGNPQGPPCKAKHELATDSAQYREGTVKRTPGGE